MVEDRRFDAAQLAVSDDREQTIKCYWMCLEVFKLYDEVNYSDGGLSDE